jgi:TolB-like protein/DNA-binding winged helix-turn-helix (wHTH) protein/Tfp pilus assembly protein PilF
MDAAGPPRYVFDRFQFDPLRGQLRSGSEAIDLRPKCQAVLGYLLAHPGRLVGKDELLGAVWGKVVVTEDSLVQCVGEIRQVLGDDGQRFIRTIPRSGYLFVAEVSEVSAHHAGDGPPAAPPGPPPPPPTAPPPAPAPAPPRRWSERVAGRLVARPVLALPILLALAAAALLWAAAPGRSVVASVFSSRAAPRPLSIAVVPLTNIDGDPAQEYLAQGITGDLATDLGQLPGALVISRNSARDYQGGSADARVVARELGVRYVVAGSVQRLRDDVQVHLRLIDGETGAQQWAERFQGPRADLPRLQLDVVRRIAQTLQIRLLESEAERISRERPRNPDAQDLLMRGWALWERRRAADNAQARASFEQALALDPAYSLAWVGLANTHLSDLHSGWTDDRQASLDRAREAMERAYAVGPRHRDVNAGRGYVLFFTGDVESALAAFDQEIEANPGNALAHVWRGLMLVSLGRAAEAIPAIQRGMTLSPRDVDLPMFYRSMAHACFSLSRYGEAAAWAQKAVGLSPGYVKGHAFLAAAAALQGDPTTAAGAVDRVRSLQPKFDSVASFRQSLMPGELRMFDATPRFYEGLHNAGLPTAQAG